MLEALVHRGLASVLVALHAVFGFIRCLCLSIKLMHADDVQCLSYQGRLDLRVEKGLTRQRG